MAPRSKKAIKGLTDGTTDLSPEAIATLQKFNPEDIFVDAPADLSQIMLMAPSTEIASTEITEAVAAVIEGETETPPVTEPEAPVVAEPETPAPINAEAISFDDALKAIDEDTAKAMTLTAAKAFDERADFERVKDPSNENIQRTLKKARAQITTLRAARVMIATNVDPSVFNRTIHENTRYNVYAIGKLTDAVFGLTDEHVKNAINLACMKSLFQFRAAKAQYTGEMAKASASDKIRITDAVKAHLVRHTVSASTAPTQASSTMQALETLGIVKRSGSGKNPNFDLTSNPIVDKLEAVLAA